MRTHLCYTANISRKLGKLNKKKKLVSVLRNSQIKEVDWELGLGGAAAIPAPVIKVLPDRGHGDRARSLEVWLGSLEEKSPLERGAEDLISEADR